MVMSPVKAIMIGPSGLIGSKFSSSTMAKTKDKIPSQIIFDLYHCFTDAHP